MAEDAENFAFEFVRWRYQHLPQCCSEIANSAVRDPVLGAKTHCQEVTEKRERISNSADILVGYWY